MMKIDDTNESKRERERKREETERTREGTQQKKGQARDVLTEKGMRGLVQHSFSRTAGDKGLEQPSLQARFLRISQVEFH